VRHPLFCFISFIGIGSPLTDIVIVHIFYINESNPYTTLMSISHIQICYQLLQTKKHQSTKPTHPPIHDCDAVGVAFYYLVFANAKPLPEVGNNNYLWYPSISPYLRPLIVGAAEGGERRQTNTPKAY